MVGARRRAVGPMAVTLAGVFLAVLGVMLLFRSLLLLAVPATIPPGLVVAAVGTAVLFMGSTLAGTPWVHAKPRRRRRAA